ncbi:MULTISPECIES: DUF4440 domain-containing protein [unclassified Listeria]|uniref:nuclear transport factor 2 family protein n=2 Tax=Listeria TaxID=1637 RepID=UPI0021011D03|nr:MULTISPECIES: DUF4440 domain-containing protein [unclassified Listeria]
MMPMQECNFYELEMTHLNAENRSTMTEILNLLDENYLEFGKSGNKTQKKDYLNASLPADQYEILEFESHSLGQKSQLTTYTLLNHTTNETSLRSSIWKYQNGHWKLYFHQGTPVN